jgi:hypothetical protein
VGIFNNPAGSAEYARRLGLSQQANYDPEILTTIGSLDTIAGQPRYYAIDRRGGYAHTEGYGSSNNHAPLPVALRYDGAPSTLTLPVWEPVKVGTEVKLRLVLFNHVEGDEVVAQLNGAALKRQLVDAQRFSGWSVKHMRKQYAAPPTAVGFDGQTQQDRTGRETRGETA